MSFRNYLASAVGGIAALFTPLDTLQAQTQKENANQVAIYQIEQAVQKWPQHLVDLIEDDYSDGKRTKLLSFFYGDEEAVFCGIRGFMSFDPNSTAIRITKTPKPLELELVEHSIFHELGHFLTFSYNDKPYGLMTLPSYTGPSYQELRSLAKRGLKLPQNADALENGVLLITTYGRVGYANSKLANLEYVWQSYFDKVTTPQKMEIDRIAERLESNLLDSGRMKEKIAVLKRPMPEVELSMRNLKQRLKALNEEFERDLNVAGKRRYYDERASELIEDTRVENTVKDYLMQIESRRDLILSIEENDRLRLYQKFYKNMASSFDMSIGYHREACFDNLRERAEKYAFDPNEYLARAIASIVEMNAGNVGIHRPFKSDKLLDSLSEMRLDGLPVFGDLIYRYRLTEDFVKQGYSPSEAKAIVGSTPQSNFKIRGNPRLESPAPSNAFFRKQISNN